MAEKIKRKDASTDTVQEAMGHYGPWHIIIAVSLSLVTFPVAWHQLTIVFLAPPPIFNCISPESLDNTTMRCEVTVANNVTEKCTAFKYDKSIFEETIITQWDLVCDRQPLANVVQTVTMFAVLIGNMAFGMLADRIGRKIPLVIAVLLLSLTGLASAFAPYYELFLVLKFLAALATGGSMLISFVIIMEIVGVEWRPMWSVLFHLPFITGNLINVLISYATRTWYGFQIAISVPPILLLSYYWVIPESPRWLLAVGRVDEAQIILTKAAKRNKIPFENVKIAIESYSESNSRDAQAVTEKYSILHLFKTPNLRVKTLCVCANWLSCGICFFGLTQYVGTLSGDIFVNVAAAASMQLPGTVLVLFLISRVSRLKVMIGGNLLSGLSLLLLVFISNSTARVTLATIGLVGMSISFPTVYLYSTEVFPTVVRNVGLGLASVSSRIGSMVAPFIATMDTVQPWLPPLLFGIGPLIAAVLCLFLPETMGCELPETIEDGEKFGKRFSGRKDSLCREIRKQSIRSYTS
ncbi:organic cation transporter protein-like isoform X1 [Diprion similis]|uniref:organic cation transporter protein-like isoform X1 n=1 Tax=Diprion similis TaxID=362088 RepID=UPI001EF88615|nr:organic cation transporter protein-like isoform X1 [Diprion similis]